VARFAVQRVDDFKGKPIQTWVYARDRDAGFYDFAVPTKQVLGFYDEHIGPFAYEKLANITSPVSGGGMEAASAIMYSETSVTGERSVRWRNVVIHEIAHQWFGNAVTESDWDHVWLSEGFATYFTLLFREHAYGRDDFVSGLEDAAERVWPWYEQHPDYRVVHDGLDDMSRVTSIATYQKGAWVLHMLRKRVGDEAFWVGVRSYYADHMNDTASTEDFRRAMEEASGTDLEAFFDQWLRQGGNPELRGSWTYDPDAGAVRIELSQIQDVGTFVMPLEIGVYLEGDRTPAVLESVEVGGGVQRFVIPVAEEPTDVRLDPDSWALFRADFGRAAVPPAEERAPALSPDEGFLASGDAMFETRCSAPRPSALESTAPTPCSSFPSRRAWSSAASRGQGWRSPSWWGAASWRTSPSPSSGAPAANDSARVTRTTRSGDWSDSG
jgi:aminopeptidase N